MFIQYAGLKAVEEFTWAPFMFCKFMPLNIMVFFGHISEKEVLGLFVVDRPGDRYCNLCLILLLFKAI